MTARKASECDIKKKISLHLIWLFYRYFSRLDQFFTPRGKKIALWHYHKHLLENIQHNK